MNHTPKSMDYMGTGWKFCLVIKSWDKIKLVFMSIKEKDYFAFL